MKRLYERASWRQGDGGFAIVLDEKAVATPAGVAVLLPEEPLARAIAGEWAAQTGDIATASMPLTRLAYAAIDHVAPCLAEVAAGVARFAETDLVCYRAAGPEALCERQDHAWQPLVDWARERFDAPLVVTTGVTPVAQETATLEALGKYVAGLDAFALTGLQGVVAVAGSLVIGLAVAEGRLTAAEAWAASRIDEDFQAGRWGEVEEAAEYRDRHHADLLAAAEFLALCRPGG